MALDPNKHPKEFLTIFLAVGLFLFKKYDVISAFNESEQFISETERRYGKINP